jgi:hypothetical protein
MMKECHGTLAAYVNARTENNFAAGPQAHRHKHGGGQYLPGVLMMRGTLEDNGLGASPPPPWKWPPGRRPGPRPPHGRTAGRDVSPGIRLPHKEAGQRMA